MTYHIVANAAAGILPFAAVRWLTQQSGHVGAIVATGLLARIAVGLSLFWMSYLDLPVFRSLQLSGGFWTLMGDARGYDLCLLKSPSGF